MKNKSRPTFSLEFKKEAAELVLDQGYSVRQAAEALNVSKSSIDLWTRQLKNERRGITSSASPMTSDKQRIRELERQLRRKETENEILKKATALLMSDSINGLR